MKYALIFSCLLVFFLSTSAFSGEGVPKDYPVIRDAFEVKLGELKDAPEPSLESKLDGEIPGDKNYIIFNGSYFKVEPDLFIDLELSPGYVLDAYAFSLMREIQRMRFECRTSSTPCKI